MPEGCVVEEPSMIHRQSPWHGIYQHSALLYGVTTYSVRLGHFLPTWSRLHEILERMPGARMAWVADDLHSTAQPSSFVLKSRPQSAGGLSTAAESAFRVWYGEEAHGFRSLQAQRPRGRGSRCGLTERRMWTDAMFKGGSRLSRKCPSRPNSQTPVFFFFFFSLPVVQEFHRPW
ncbi:hypothetical protein VTN31DRAFT_4360 [Thermomyces dupontii]|uniref:uncharacterized protein n=1 Tax=Talaromyces thermophilus TaxID=28565 RepID=UPI0037440DC7